jgi:hypothetical protein
MLKVGDLWSLVLHVSKPVCGGNSEIEVSVALSCITLQTSENRTESIARCDTLEPQYRNSDRQY